MDAVQTSGPKPLARPYAGVSATDRVASRRERLLEAGLELYGTRGFAATGVKDVCRRARLTDRYFYESFRDSAELFTAVFDRATSDLLARVARKVGEVPPEPESQVRASIETFVRALAADPRKARVVLVESTSAGAEVDRHIRASLRQFAGLVATTARRHLPEMPERLLVLGSLSLVGAIERVIIEWQDGYLDATIEEVIDHLVQLFLIAGASVGVSPRTGQSRHDDSA
ncbi:MAG TPA: TetR/AcrR family transcriptional regulator [Acidimicrobiales bacterium]|nr:TetR/AcrR family transcriptional regulator [Acidimicrobiales bacterium]